MMKKLLFIPLAASIALFSCKKEEDNSLPVVQQQQILEMYEYVTLQKNNESRNKQGSLAATVTGFINPNETKYADEAYSQKIDYKFTNQSKLSVENINFNTNPVNINYNVMAEEEYFWTNENDVDVSYTIKYFVISMYENDGLNQNNSASDNYMKIFFQIFEGDITPNMEDEGIRVSTSDEMIPNFAMVNYSFDYTPNKTIDYLPINESFMYTYDSNDELDENLVISNFDFNSETGEISFDFEGNDPDQDIIEPAIENGSVSTKLVYNLILESIDNTFNNPI